MKSIKVFNKFNQQICPNKLSLQRCCQKKNYMQRKCQTMKNILMVLFKHDNYSQERCFKKIQGQNVYSYIAL